MKVSTRCVGAAAAVALGASLLGGCASATEEAPATLRIGVGTDQAYGALDLLTSTRFVLPVSAIYDGLFSTPVLESGGFTPELATGFERSDDWKTVTVTLRDDVTFADGEKFTAETLKTYLDGVSANDGWAFASYWNQSSPTLTAEDTTTLTITSDTPMHLRAFGFLSMLFTNVPIASTQALDHLEGTGSIAVGSGPYLLDEVTPEVGVTLVRNEDYWNRDAYPFATVEITTFTDEVAALNALKAGQIDATRLSIPFAQDAERNGFTLSEGPGRVALLYIADRDGTVNPALGDPRVRQAIAFAFDREAINESINVGYGTVTSQPFAAGTPEYVDGGDDRYAYDPDRARELLAEAGYPDGFDLTIPSTAILGIDSWEPIVAQYLGDIGIRVTFDTIADSGAFYGAVAGSTDYPVLMYSERPTTMLPVFIAPTAFFNPFKVEDPEILDRYAFIQSGPDDAAERATDELGEYLLDEAILIPFSSQPYIWATRPGIEVDHVDGYPPLQGFRLAG